MVSKLEPPLLIATVPSPGAVHAYQTERPPGLPRINGSPASRVAADVSPASDPPAPSSDCAAANGSFAGVAPEAVQVSVNVPSAGTSPAGAQRGQASKPSTAIR